jgi:nitroreductase
MEVFEAIRANRSVRQFSDEPVAREIIERIVNAGRLAGSAKNRQPWTFVVATDRTALEALSQCGPWTAHTAGAAFVVVLVVENLREPETLTTPFDLGRASQNMILAAWDLGIGSVMGTIYQPEVARAALGIPAGKDIPWLISFGYPHPDADPRARPPRAGGRHALDEVVRWEVW